MPGGGAPFADAGAYLPARAGEQLVYSVQQSTTPGAAVTGSVGLRVATVGTVAGVQTVELDPTTPVAAQGGAQAAYPFGLGGGTVRVEGGAVVRAAQGGTVRDLVGPLRPGLRWSDARSGEAGLTTTETRVALGPAAITEPAGRFDRCVVVALASVVSGVTAGGGSTAAGYAWYCEGVGLVHAVLSSSSGETDVIDLASVR